MMISLLKRLFYDAPIRGVKSLLKATRNRFSSYSEERKALDTKFIENEINALGREVDSIDDVLERTIIPTLLEYDLGSGALEDEEVKYLDKRATTAAIESRSFVNSQVLTSLRTYEKTVPPEKMREYFSTWNAYQQRVSLLREKHEDMDSA